MKDYLEDVPSDSSPEDEEIIDSELEDEDLDAKPKDESEGDDKDGRSIDNVYRELSRKQEDFQERMMNAMLDGQKQLMESINRPAEPDSQTGNTLDKMSMPDLESLRGRVAEENPDKLGEFDVYISKRRVDEAVEAQMSKFMARQTAETGRKEASQLAGQRYPELGDRSSDFYRQVNNKLAVLGDSYVANNPRAVLDAANDVAAELGVAPRDARQTQRSDMRGRVAQRRNSAPVQKNDEELDVPVGKEDRAQIAKNLAGALPKGKKFDDEAITKQMAEYKKNINYFTRG